MKTSFVSVAMAVLASIGAMPSHAIEVGQPAPTFELPARQGQLKSADFKGQVVYLDFWASWCGPCKQSFPWMNEMNARYGSKGLRMVGINLDQKPDDARAFLNNKAAAFEVAFDPAGKTPRQYGIKGMPTSVLLGPDGRVLMVHTGFKPEDRQELEQQIKQALKLKD